MQDKQNYDFATTQIKSSNQPHIQFKWIRVVLITALEHLHQTGHDAVWAQIWVP